MHYKTKQNSRGSILDWRVGHPVYYVCSHPAIYRGSDQRIPVHQSQFQGQEDMRSQAYCFFDTALAVLHEIKEIDGQLYRPVQGWGDPIGYSGIPLPDGVDVQVKITDESGRLPIENRQQRANLESTF